MTVAQKIRKALKGIMSEGEVDACKINKGYHYDGSVESNGWYYTPFGRTAIHLGENEAEALETIEQIAEERNINEK